MSMRMVGWPSEAETARSVMPGTVAMAFLISSATLASVSRSLPDTLTEFSPFTPEAASCTLSWMYCEKVNSMPGEAFDQLAHSIGVVVAGLERDRRRHDGADPHVAFLELGQEFEADRAAGGE